MAFKFNIGSKDGKSWKFELESEDILGKSLGEVVKGEELLPSLKGYEFEISGASDKAGIPSLKQVEGTFLKKVLLNYGKGMHKKSRKEGKKLRSNMKPNGLRRRKTIRGKIISPDMMQINLKVLKEGHEKLNTIFAEQNQPKEKSKPKAE